MTRIPLLTHPDVLVIGGGSAGVAAAVAAKRSGASVVLLEKNAFAGGKATAANVGTICGLYYRSESDDPEWVNRGFPEAFARALKSRCGLDVIRYRNGLHFLPYRHDDFKRLCDEWIGDVSLFHATVYNANRAADRVERIDALVANQQVAFFPNSVIDTSGDSLVHSLLNADVISSDRNQAAAQVFGVYGVDESDEQVISMALLRAVKSGIGKGLVPGYLERVSVVPGSVNAGALLIKIPVPLPVHDDPAAMTALELFSRKAVDDMMRCLKSSNGIFSECTTGFISSEVGIRTGKRNRGTYVLSDEDVMTCRKHAGSVARGAWPVEYWEPGQPVTMEYFTMNDYYDIPAGALQSAAFSNLYFAGRNLSATDKAIASARVIGTCLATGYAAGVLAADASRGKSQEHSIASIQQSMLGKSVWE